MTLDFPSSPTDGQLYPASPATPLWEFTAGKGWKRLGGGGLVLPSQAEAEDGTTAAARAWSSLRVRQAVEAWYLTQAPLDTTNEFEPQPFPLGQLLDWVALYVAVVPLTETAIGTDVAAFDDLRFGSTAQTLGVQSNSAKLRGPGSSWEWGSVNTSGTNRGVYLLTINSTSAFSLDVSDLPGNPDWWEADVIITTTQVPASFSFISTGAVPATKCDVPGFTLADNPFAVGKVTVLKLQKVSENRYAAKFNPAVTIT